MKLPVDRTLAVSIRQQIRGGIAHGIAFGSLTAGEPLPPVRELAEQAGISPMTVSKIYAELKADGLIEGRSGSGTFVAESALTRAAASEGIHGFCQQIDATIDHARNLGISPADVAALINARGPRRPAPVQRFRIVMAGLFADATASYAARVAEQVGHLAAVEPVTLDAIRADPAVLERARDADLVLTFADLQGDVEQTIREARVISLRFIPSEATRLALASLNPMARVAVVSRFPEFLPILTLGFRRFAAHVQTFVSLPLEAPDIARVLADQDVLVISTGADDAARHAPPGIPIIEYRHIPDPGDIDRLVLPALTGAGGRAVTSRKEAS